MIAEPAVRLRSIHKSFGPNEVLKGVDLLVSPGEHVVVFGPSGSGKSTLLRTINLLEPPTSGSVQVYGTEYGPGLPGERARRGPADRAAPARSAWCSSSSTCSRTSAPSTTSPSPCAGRSDRQARRARARRRRAAPGRPARPRGQVPQPAVRRPAAARRDRPGAGDGSQGDAVRRADLGPRPRARRRGAGDDAPGRRARHDDGGRHPRDGLRPRDRRPQRVHGRRVRRRAGRSRDLRRRPPDERTRKFIEAVL